MKHRPRGGVDGLPATICALPWVNLSLDVNGSSRPCCKFAQPSPESPYQLANLQDGDLAEVWNGDAMQRLRKDFVAGVKPAECSSCWREEEAGIPSWRQTFLADRAVSGDIDYHDAAPDHPRALDLKLSNACNLKCRICGPVASSLWLNEELAQPGEPTAFSTYLRDNRSYFLSNKITHQADDLEVFRSWIPHLEHVEMTGGEPMFSAENREVIDLLVTEGHPERISLLLTTNSTVIDERIMAQLTKFAHVTVSLSIDDIGARLEYERAPADWPTVERNVARYAALASPTFKLFTNCSVSSLNVWYLPEYLGWFSRSFPNGEITFSLNLVHGPSHYNVRALPAPLKAAVRSRLRRALRAGDHPAEIRDQVTGLIDFMAQPAPEREAWSRFVQVTDQRDAVRDQSFADTFGEYHAEIVRLGLWDATARRSPSPAALLGWPRRRRKAAT